VASFYMLLAESHICDNETGTVGRWQLCAAHIGTNPHAYRGEQRHNMQEEIGRTALTQYLINSRELAEIDLSIGEMNDLLESHKKVPSEIADLYEEGQL